MSDVPLEEMGPVDYLVMEWKADQPVTGEALGLILDLVDRGIIRVLDLAFLAKDEDGTVSAVDLAELGDETASQRSEERRVGKGVGAGGGGGRTTGK